MAKRRGMSQRQLENVFREDWYRFVVFPIIVLVGLYVVAAILDVFLKTNYEHFPILFTAIGGIPFLIYYYRGEIQRHR